jgi:hypothetical protein
MYAEQIVLERPLSIVPERREGQAHEAHAIHGGAHAARESALRGLGLLAHTPSCCVPSSPRARVVCLVVAWLCASCVRRSGYGYSIVGLTARDRLLVGAYRASSVAARTMLRHCCLLPLLLQQPAAPPRLFTRTSWPLALEAASDPSSDPAPDAAHADGAPPSFGPLRVPPGLSDRLRACGFTYPMPVQREAMPLIADGQNVVIHSATGSGKVLARAPRAAASVRAPPASARRARGARRAA